MHIPIIGNGDVTTPERCKECFDRYGVDAVMIGRASFGRPWIFKEVKHYLETGEELPPLSFDWCMEVLRQEVVDSVNLLDERRGILHVRRHLAASPLFKGIPNFRNTRISMLRAETKEELFRIFEEMEITCFKIQKYVPIFYLNIGCANHFLNIQVTTTYNRNAEKNPTMASIT